MDDGDRQQPSPAWPDAYKDKPTNIVDPFTLPSGAVFAYDSEIGRRRPGLVNPLFDLALVQAHAENTALWRAIRAAEVAQAAGPTSEGRKHVAEARRLAGFVPVTEKDAGDFAFLERFANHDAPDAALVAAWRAALAN